MDIQEIYDYLNEQYPDLRLNVLPNKERDCIEIVGRIQYGFTVEERTATEFVLDSRIRAQMEHLIDLAQNTIDKMKIKVGIKQEILGVQAVLVEGGEYWVSEIDYATLLDQSGESPQSGVSMTFGGKPIRYHELLS